MLQFAAVGAAFLFVAMPWPIQVYAVAIAVGPDLVGFHRAGLARLEAAGLRASSRPKLPAASTVSACPTPRPSR